MNGIDGSLSLFSAGSEAGSELVVLWVLAESPSCLSAAKRQPRPGRDIAATETQEPGDSLARLVRVGSL